MLTSFINKQINHISRFNINLKSVFKPSKFLFINNINHQFSQAVTQPKDNELHPFNEKIKNFALLQKLTAKGFIQMFPIQQKSFQIISKGKNLLASDRTGSGKTLAYSLPIIQKFNRLGYNGKNIKNPKFLIICPTRQLVLQVTQEISYFSNDFKVVSIYGGASISLQQKQLKSGVTIIVGTPGRLIDFISSEKIILKDIEAICIDQADTMLEKGFKQQIQKIFQSFRNINVNPQKLMFSATIPPWVDGIIRQYMPLHQKINLIGSMQQKTSNTIQHLAMKVNFTKRHQNVIHLIQKYNPHNHTIIFTKTKAQATQFIKYFKDDEIVVLHGDIPQNLRQKNILQFKKGYKKILVATDVASRGLDIPNVQLVIQLSPPQNTQPYIHRSGRTGRAGKAGVNITFFDEQSIEDLLKIQKQAKIQIKLISNSHSSLMWKIKGNQIVSQIINSPKQKTDILYKKFVSQLLIKLTPQEAILKLIKQKIGKIPPIISAISGLNGFFAYSATLASNQTKLKLQQIFKDIKLHRLNVQEEQIKFDIFWQDQPKFQKMILQQNHYIIKPIDEGRATLLKRNYETKQRNVTKNSLQIYIGNLDGSVKSRDIQRVVKQKFDIDVRAKVLKKQDEKGGLRYFSFISVQNKYEYNLIIKDQFQINGKLYRPRQVK